MSSPTNEAGRKGPTVAQLKADINSGRTGDKVQVSDPGLSPLGTDDEAAGRPNATERVAMARAYENRNLGAGGKPDNPALNPRFGAASPLFIGFIGLVALAFLALLWFL